LAQTNNSVELQKLGVVPQTIFVGTRSSEASFRTGGRHFNMEGRSPAVYGSPRISRAGSTEHINHLDDLRRRLVGINGSSSSLTHLADRERRASASSTRPSIVPSPVGPDPPTGVEQLRPSSPTDSVVSSAVDGSSLRPRALIHVGSTDNQKAPAAVGSVKTNAVGLLETPSVPRLGDDDLSASGRSSPVSNPGTLRAEHRTSLHSARQYSGAFGMFPMPFSRFTLRRLNAF
jgi:phosphoinositide-3-kinase, regulatory subunit 4